MRFLLSIFVVFFLNFISCILLEPVAPPNPVAVSSPTIPPGNNVNINYPNNGNTNNAAIVVKDYETRGMIFVKSTEVIDGNGNHIGSKITYEMLMREAQKLGADDVINIKIDVNQTRENLLYIGYNVDKTTYNYTASALAIKYTTAIPIATNNYQDISKVMELTSSETRRRVDRSFNILDNGIIFPSGFIGIWKRDNFDNTLTFTSNSIRSSSQEGSMILFDASLDLYTLINSNNEKAFIITIRLINDNIEIRGGTGSGQGNWSGVWRKQ